MEFARGDGCKVLSVAMPIQGGEQGVVLKQVWGDPRGESGDSVARRATQDG